MNILLSSGEQLKAPWSFLNLALEYRNFIQRSFSQVDAETLKVCEDVLSRNTDHFESNRHEVAIVSVKQGYFCLLRKCLKAEGLFEGPAVDDAAPDPVTPGVLEDATDTHYNTLLHIAAKTGFPWITKSIVESLGIPNGKEWVNERNSFGQSPLHLACKHRAPKQVFLLLKTLVRISSKFLWPYVPLRAPDFETLSLTSDCLAGCKSRSEMPDWAHSATLLLSQSESPPKHS
jgi:hypothetical protein